MSKSLKQTFLEMDHDKQISFIESLSDEEAASLLQSWEWEARPEQLPPKGDWFVWLLLMGRGAGKTRAASEYIVDQIKNHGHQRIALVGRTAADVRDVMVTGKSGILSIARLRGLNAHHEPSKRQITFENGAVATTYSAESGDQLRGPEHSLAWADEVAAWPTGKGDADAFSNLLFGLRIGTPKLVCSTTPRPTNLIKKLVNDPRTVISYGSTLDNAPNLAPAFIEEIERRYKGTRLWRQEVGGQILEDTEGALWNLAMIEESRADEVPPLKRVVVSVDPATTTSETSDYTGIAVVGLSATDELYLLHSEQVKLSPHGWATRVLDLYDEYEADRIIAERNQGGQMVESTLRTVRKNAPITTIHASRGKQTRAEPVAALMEQGKVHHVGEHLDLEEQMVVFPVVSDVHDDLVDAYVYAITELAGLGKEEVGQFITYARGRRRR